MPGNMLIQDEAKIVCLKYVLMWLYCVITIISSFLLVLHATVGLQAQLICYAKEICFKTCAFRASFRFPMLMMR